MIFFIGCLKKKNLKGDVDTLGLSLLKKKKKKVKHCIIQEINQEQQQQQQHIHGRT